ncbi:hypothetical protein GL58_12930 [Comamonas testosteroni]|uniref:Uncharacterized protein n=2 Tax=Comamonas testosteroni TaxID=285 RepID=A0A0L7MEM7_COMTE|nr:hypothetical protein GL58_12930 [Comamonas testosteroni]
MIEAVGQKWPQYALWLVTGVSDEKHGHHAPHPMWSFPNFDPDAENDPNGSGHYEKTTEFFRLAAHLASTAWQAGPPRQSMNESGDCKVQSLNRKDKHFERNFTLLQTLWELKEKEFLANNSQYDTTSP